MRSMKQILSQERKKSLIRVRPFINFKIKATMPGGLFTSKTMLFPDSITAHMWARDEYGRDAKIEVKPA